MSLIDFDTIVSDFPVPKWNHSAADIKRIANEIIESEKAMLDTISTVGTPTIETVLKPYVTMYHTNSFLESQLTFYSSVSPEKEIRDASTEVKKLLQNHAIESQSRKDVYSVFKQLDDSVDHSTLDAETNRFLEKLLLSYRRSGLELPDKDLLVYKGLKKKLSDLAVAFNNTMNEQTEFLLFTNEELEGVPQDVTDGFEKVEGKLKMTYKYPDLFPVLKHAIHQDTRKRAFNGNQSKCGSNAAVLTEMIQIRFKIAKLLGYKTYSEYVLEERMAKNQANVLDFLNDLKEKLTPLGKKELKVLKQFKNDELASRDLPPQQEFFLWDMSYYDNLLLEQKYQVDHLKIQEYFPLETTISKMLSFYESIFDVKFHRIETPAAGTIWHEDVKQFAVFQNIKFGTPRPKFMGFIYFDLHPREGKYGHAASFGLGPGFEREDGSRQHPVNVLVCNFTKPVNNKPSLLKHSEVTTFFHELGHGVHSMLAETKYATFHGTRVPRDFVEAPSQMLEFWVWSKNELKSLSSHYKTGEPINDKLIDQLISSKNVNNGLQNLRQLHFGLFDMTLHTIEDKKEIETLNLLPLWNDLRGDLSMMSNDGIYTPGYASFGHIAGGYSSGYYGYLYSKVFAVDIFYSLFKANPMDVETGLRYRDAILKRGNSREMMENLSELLGREPNSVNFMNELLG